MDYRREFVLSCNPGKLYWDILGRKSCCRFLVSTMLMYLNHQKGVTFACVALVI